MQKPSTIIIIILLIAYHLSISTGQSKNSITKNFLIGASAGAVGTVLLEPLVYFKNSWQQQKTIKLNPKIWYRGLFINASGSIPTLAVQNMVYNSLKEQCNKTSLDNYKELISAFGAGVASSPITCPRELLIIQQQNHGGNFYHLTRSFIAKHGYKTLLTTGLAPITIRNSFYASSLFVVTPKIKEQLKGANNSIFQNIGAPALAGILSALLTHPLDTIKTQMQARIGTTSFQAFYNLCNSLNTNNKKYGIQALYHGLLPRITGVACSITIVSNAKDYISNLVEK